MYGMYGMNRWIDAYMQGTVHLAGKGLQNVEKTTAKTPVKSPWT